MNKVRDDDVGYTRHVQQRLKSNPGSEDARLPPNEGSDGLVTKLYGACLESFQSILQATRSEVAVQLHSDVLQEEVGKLFLWGESFKSGELDKALAFASGLHEIVLTKFVNITRLLLGLRHCLGFVRLDGLELDERLHTLLQEARLDLVQRRAKNQDYDDSSSENDSDEGIRSIRDQISQIGPILRTQISHLLSMGRVIRRSLVQSNKHELKLKSRLSPIVSSQVSDAASFYVTLIGYKFKNASKGLVRRLGEASWQRHQNVQNISTGKEVIGSGAKPPPTSTSRPVSTLNDSGFATGVPDESLQAPSYKSFLSSDTNGELGDLRVPATPHEVQYGKPFKCFLCQRRVTHIKSRRDWKIHVYRDLRPYLCTFTGCKAELTQFSSRTEWGEHEFTYHRLTSSWRCQDCQTTCSELTDFENHAKGSHGRQINTSAWQTTLELALNKLETPVEHAQCPLCLSIPGGSRRTFINHVARHMEQIALVVMPQATKSPNNGAESDGSESLSDSISNPDEALPAPKSGQSGNGNDGLQDNDREKGEDTAQSRSSQPFQVTEQHVVSQEIHRRESDDLPTQLRPASDDLNQQLEDQLEDHAAMAATVDQASPETSSIWSPQQDEILIQLKQQGLDWSSVASGIPHRTATACRKRHKKLMDDYNSKTAKVPHSSTRNLNKKPRLYPRAWMPRGKLKADPFSQQSRSTPIRSPSSPSLYSQEPQAMSSMSNQNNDTSRHWMPVARLHNNFQGIHHSSHATLGQDLQAGTPLATWLAESYDSPWHSVGEVGELDHIPNDSELRISPGSELAQPVKEEISTSGRATNGSDKND